MKTIFGIFFCSFGLSALAGPFLVTAEEMLASHNAPPQFTSRSVPVQDAPTIELTAPKLSTPVSSPTSIELRFQPKAPSTVKPESFRVLYGAFGLDITKRLLSVAKVSEQGVFVQEASLPKGRHKLTMVVEDSAGRKGNRTVEFDVN
jgi:hypothetical protein